MQKISKHVCKLGNSISNKRSTALLSIEKNLSYDEETI